MRRSQLHRETAEAQASDDIIVYPNRPRLAAWTALSGVLALLCGLFVVAILILAIIIPSMRDDWAVLFLILLFGGFFALEIWQTLLFLRMLRAKEPLLVINRAGIRIGKICGPSDIFLRWEELRSISSRPPYKVLGISPLDNRRFLASLRLGMRFICLLNLLTGSPITIYRSFMDKPIKEVLEQTHTRYARELELHRAIEQEDEASGPSSRPTGTRQ